MYFPKYKLNPEMVLLCMVNKALSANHVFTFKYFRIPHVFTKTNFYFFTKVPYVSPAGDKAIVIAALGCTKCVDPVSYALILNILEANSKIQFWFPQEKEKLRNLIDGLVVNPDMSWDKNAVTFC